MTIVGTFLTLAGTVLTIIGFVDRKRERERTAALSAEKMVPAMLEFLTELGLPITDAIRARLEAMAKSAKRVFAVTLIGGATLHEPTILTEVNPPDAGAPPPKKEPPKR
jgi:hypothetical protein